MNYQFPIITIVFLAGLGSCKFPENKHIDNNNGSSMSLMISDSAIAADSRLSSFDYYIKTYADSINKINSPANFPDFLKDAQFDYNHSGLWSPSHNPLPMRFMILSKVNNCSALKMIIESGNSFYKQRPRKEANIDVEYIQFSFHDIASNRYAELNCDRK